MAASIDTLSIADRLIAAGASKELAREHAEIIKEMVDERFVTKRDLRELELRLTVRLGGIVIACTGILLALIPYLVHLK